MRFLLPIFVLFFSADAFSQSRGGLMSWSDLVGQPLPEPTKVIKIGDGSSDVCDLWLPEGDGPHPVVLMIHGGCWQKGIADRTLMNYAAEALRKRGLAVWNIEYRGVDERGGGYPGTFEDVARGADALKVHAKENGISLEKVAAFGHSAGGHLALWLAGRKNLPESSPLAGGDPLKIHTVINSGGLADLEASAPLTIPSCLPRIMDGLTGRPSETRSNVFSDTSPSELFPLGVVQICVNGAEDGIAPPQIGENYTKKAIEAGDPATLNIVPNTGHVELIAPKSKAFEIQAKMLEDVFK